MLEIRVTTTFLRNAGTFRCRMRKQFFNICIHIKKLIKRKENVASKILEEGLVLRMDLSQIMPNHLSRLKETLRTRRMSNQAW